MPLVVFFGLLSFVLFSLLLFYIIKRYRIKRKVFLLDHDDSNFTYEFIKKENVIRSDELDLEVKTWVHKNFDFALSVHGTFVGEDPFHFLKYLELCLPNKLKKYIRPAKSLVKNGHDTFFKDFGNFSKDYLEEVSKKKLSFNWSSGNHHYARVVGMIELLKKLSESEFNKALLIGHSHAGQLFSLSSQFLYNSKFQKLIIENFSDYISKNELNLITKNIKNKKLTFITYGTPPRYRWFEHKNIKVYHFINNRLPTIYAKDLSGILKTKNGDYIQLLGSAGSDFISIIDKENKLNKKLDNELGVGIDLKYLKDELSYLKRTHNYGHHFFVDYGDNSNTVNFLKTGFGHGVYTRSKLLNFHLLEVMKKELNE